MPDEFPTLEAVAGLALLAALVRLAQIGSALAQVPRLTAELEGALADGDTERAQGLAEGAQGATFASLIAALLEELGAGATTRERLRSALDEAGRRAAERSRRRRATGGLAGLLLLGLLAFAIGTSLGVGSGRAPGTTFNVLVALGVLVLLAGVALGERLLRSTREASKRLLDAAARLAESQRLGPTLPCKECGELEQLRIDRTVLGRAAELGLGDLAVCRACGAVSGRAEHPEELKADPERGVHAAHAEPPPEEPADPDEEYEG